MGGGLRPVFSRGPWALPCPGGGPGLPPLLPAPADSAALTAALGLDKPGPLAASTWATAAPWPQTWPLLGPCLMKLPNVRCDRFLGEDSERKPRLFPRVVVGPQIHSVPTPAAAMARAPSSRGFKLLDSIWASDPGALFLNFGDVHSGLSIRSAEVTFLFHPFGVQQGERSPHLWTQIISGSKWLADFTD